MAFIIYGILATVIFIGGLTMAIKYS